MPNDYIALIRGINVGGKNKLPMKELAAVFTEAGCTSVRTYIQSGNVLFDLPSPSRASDSELAVLAEGVAGAITERHVHKLPIVIRSRTEMAGVLTRNPFVERGDPEDQLFVMFLQDTPTGEQIARLEPMRSAPDEFVVLGREVFLTLPTSAATTKLTNAYFDSRLATVSTSRNWRTVSKLVELLGE